MPNAGGTSISDLTSGLKQIQKSGPVDLKLSTETRDKYLNIITTFRTALQAQRTSMSNMGSLGNPGMLGSAVQTKNNLNLDVTGLDGIEQAVDQYLNYLDEFETTVKKASDRLIQSG
jgi:hypothetical protein